MSSMIAALVNVFLPGFGQLIQGRLIATLTWWCILIPLGFLTGLTGGLLLVLSFPAYVLCILDAAKYRSH